MKRGRRARILALSAILASPALAEDTLKLPIGDPARRDKTVPVVLDAITDAANGAAITPADLPSRLAGVRLLSQEVIQLRQAVESSRVSLNLELGRYQTGIDPYLDVVIQQTTLLANQQTLVTTQVAEMVAAVQLIMALGGGWDRMLLPTTREVTAKPSKADTKKVH